jgi:hypothetical protein
VSPVASLIAENPKLCEQLHRFSRAKAARLIASLGLLPQFHANTIRIEVLTHLAVVACNGSAEPKRDDLVKWLDYFDQEAWISRQEDPVEDVFVGSVNSNFGSFRLFSGILTDGCFVVERLIAFLAKAASFPTFQETLDTALALLRLSDALASRCGLKRNTAGSGNSAANLSPPHWRELKPAFDALVFKRSDLDELGVSVQSCEHFVFGEEHLEILPNERLWNSTLERRPLFQIEDGILVAEPSSLVRAISRWIVEQVAITQMGGWADTFYQQDNATIFVNDVANSLDIEAINFESPALPEHVPPLLPFFGAFDVGKPVVMLTYTAPFAPAATEFDGFDNLNVEEQKALDRYLVTLTTEFEKLPDFSGGMILVAIAGVGRGYIFGVNELGPKWHVHIASVNDWIMLAADGECSALRLWKLGEHVAQLEKYNTEFLNPSGLIALWGFWRRSDSWLAPKDLDIHNPRNLLVIGTDFGFGPRLEARIRHDIHSVRSHDATQWLSVQRLNPTPLFLQDENSRVYADRIAARERRLVGYVESDGIAWWIIAPRIEASPAHSDVLFQLWECVLQWTDRAANVIQRELSPDAQSIELRIELPDFARWKLRQKRSKDKPLTIPSIDVRPVTSSITITLHEDFLAEFNQPKNIAEQAIVIALIKGVERLANAKLTDKKREALVLEIVGNEDARFFHILETHMVEHMVGSSFRAAPLFIAHEDLAFAQIGLADLAGRPKSDAALKGKADSQDFLRKTVEKLWERIEQELKAFSRPSVVKACFRAIDEINKDAEHWIMTTRSVLAFHKEQKDTKDVFDARRNRRSIASIANRILIETAQYAASSKAEKRLNRADHAKLLAQVDLLVTMAHHHDGIAYEFLKPELQIHPRGDVEVDRAFYEEVMQKYFSHRSDKLTDQAAKSYDSYFEGRKESASAAYEEQVDEFDVAFQAEFGFSVRQLLRISDLWRKLAIESQELSGVIEERYMVDLLRESADMTAAQSERFLSRFTLPIRSGWDKDLPARCSKQDVFPWRFRRNLSLLMRPLVQVTADPGGWMISAPLFEKSAKYLTGNIYEGRLPDRFFVSEKLRSYIGEIVRKHGRAFTEQVADIFRKKGYEVRIEVKMTELGAARDPNLGDIDVLAWSSATGAVFLVESKRLTPALTVREVIQRLEDFRGDEKRKDSLGKHVRRIKWVQQNPSGIQKVTRMPPTNVKFHPLLVTSESVPMQFFSEMNFPTDQVVPADELVRYLSRK